MKGFIEVGSALIMGGMGLFLIAIIGTVLGAITGWAVGLVFGETLALLSQALGIEAAPYQLGAMFAFVGGFFTSSLSVEKKKEETS